jgi:hypothetical protein
MSNLRTVNRNTLTFSRDVNRGIVHIRSLDHSIWRSHPAQWKINIAMSQCYRHTPSRDAEMLVDPCSGLFARVSRIFENFEHRSHLTLYQPSGHSLTVDLLRMQLRWHVNRSQRLQCRHLATEIDPDQVCFRILLYPHYPLPPYIFCTSFKGIWYTQSPLIWQ